MENQTEIILINISGDDKPGLTSALTEILAAHNAIILDIGQADIHHNLSLGILFRTTENNAGLIMKELLFKAYELDVHIRFSPVSTDEYNDWVKRQGKNRYIITMLGRRLTARQIAEVTKSLPISNSISTQFNVYRDVRCWKTPTNNLNHVSNCRFAVLLPTNRRCSRNS
jgi:ACT domain-containing protein